MTSSSRAQLDNKTKASAESEGALLSGAKNLNIQINLRQIPLLAHLGVEDMNMVRAELRIKKFARRDTVIQKGSPGDSLMFLLVGKLQVVDVTEDGRVVGLRLLRAGEFFGEIAVINAAPRSASVVALSEALVAFLPSKAALHLFTESPSVASQLLKHLATKIQQDSQFRSILSIHNTAQRIFAFIAMHTVVKPGNLNVVENLPTHQELANMINTSRETVTRTLLLLTQQGIIQKDLNCLIIRKPEELQKLVQPTNQ